jgi:hypothetical protein
MVVSIRRFKEAVRREISTSPNLVSDVDESQSRDMTWAQQPIKFTETI